MTDARQRGLSVPWMIFLAGALGLFLELALIRWVSCEIRVFAYTKNLVLVAAFLGFGLGLLQAKRPARVLRAMFLLLLLVMVVRLPWASLQDYGPRQVSLVLARLSGLMVFHAGDMAVAGTWPQPLALAFAAGWTALLFLLVALVMVPFGQITGACIARMERPLTGYSINVAGSLAGILLYTGFTSISLPPLLWFTPVVVGAVFLSSRKQRLPLLGVAMAVALVLLPNDRLPDRLTIWSSYQKLELVDRTKIIVNNVSYQRMVSHAAPDPKQLTRWNVPYALWEPGRVLIVGAGSGNDAAAALEAGATRVTAVEIDSEIYAMGRGLHPDKPYDDARVQVVIDDARHFLETTRDRFDVIVFSHLDSHNQLSSYTSVRLDDYIYTVEALGEARERLADGGVVHLSFFVEQPYIGARLARNLTEAFGHAPVAVEEIPPDESLPFRQVAFFIGEPEVMGALQAASRTWAGYRPVVYDTDSIRPSTDDWPFLALYRPSIPPMILVILAVILALCGALVWRQRPKGEPFDGQLFWLGAAFMLLEVHNVSRLALVFGTTWQVNTWVIGTILSLILCANFVVEWLGRREKSSRNLAIAGLFATLGASFVVPLEWFAFPGGGVLAAVMLNLPIFFAGLVFAQAFAESASPSFALGWNALGALTGGLVESLSYVFGVPSLVLVAAAFYALAIAWRRPAAAMAGARGSEQS